MREGAERSVKVGFRRDPKKIFDEVEQVTAEMMRNGWELKDTMMESSLAYIHLFFERDLEPGPPAGAR
ncbi:MAG: hypothetical protein FWB85_00360 [Chitinispirillia bacterium]|nr:hypothetical protein [Chitinispirillia bacterium]MCL2240960.1 hypothetical protein [Chitinispirillia bacterium]